MAKVLADAYDDQGAKDGIVLHLSEGETQFLMDLVGAGVLGGGRRNDFNDPIYNCLSKAGYYTRAYGNRDFEGYVVFKKE